jgi:hypothetical protein
VSYLDLPVADPSFKHRSRGSGWALPNGAVAHIKPRSVPRALDAVAIDELPLRERAAPVGARITKRVHLTTTLEQYEWHCLTIDVDNGTGQFASTSDSALVATTNSAQLVATRCD